MKMVSLSLCFGLLLSNATFSYEDIVAERLKSFNANNETAQSLQHQLTSNQNKPQGFFSNHSLVLIYSSTCQYCHMFAPTLRQWVDTNGLNVRSISLDGRPINDFPNIEQVDKELIDTAYGDMPHGTPALFVINEETKAIYPAVIGNASYQDLNSRMEKLTVKITEFEQGTSNDK